MNLLATRDPEKDFEGDFSQKLATYHQSSEYIQYYNRKDKSCERKTNFEAVFYDKDLKNKEIEEIAFTV